jgi:hypothetical protein
VYDITGPRKHVISCPETCLGENLDTEALSVPGGNTFASSWQCQSPKALRNVTVADLAAALKWISPLWAIGYPGTP